MEDEDIFITSQKSSLFPWDNAGGPSSSADRGGFDPVIPGSDRVSVGKADVRIKATSAGRNSSIGPSFLGSNLGAIGFSPGPTDIGRLGSQDHFEFDGVLYVRVHASLFADISQFPERDLHWQNPSCRMPIWSRWNEIRITSWSASGLAFVHKPVVGADNVGAYLQVCENAVTDVATSVYRPYI